MMLAQQPAASARGDHWRPGKKFDKQLKELNLTPEQKTKIDAQRAAQREAMEKIHDSIKAKRHELRAEMDKVATDKAKIDAIAADLKNLEGQRIDREINGILQMKEALTPEQFKKLGAMREKRKHGRHGWGHKRQETQAAPGNEASSAPPEAGGGE